MEKRNLQKRQTIKVLECCDSNEYECETTCPLYPSTNAECAQTIAYNVLSYFVHKKEPAPSGNGTSPQNKTLQGNNTTKNPLCQALAYVDDAINTILESYENMSDEEQRIFDIGTTYTNMLEARKVLEKLKGGDDNV